MYPIRNGVTTGNYDNMSTYSPPVYIVNGGAGNIEDNTPSSAETGNRSYDAYIDNTSSGFGTATVHNDTALTWRYIRSSDNVVLDEITFFRSRTGSAQSVTTQSPTTPATTTGTPIKLPTLLTGL